jgi:hypothetical protein
MGLVISYCLLVFNDFVPEMKAQYNFGWAVCLLVVLQILVNLCILCYAFKRDSYTRLKLVLVKYSRRISQKICKKS